MRGEELVGEPGPIGIAEYSNVPNFGGSGGGFMPSTITSERASKAVAVEREKKKLSRAKKLVRRISRSIGQPQLEFAPAMIHFIPSTAEESRRVDTRSF